MISLLDPIQFGEIHLPNRIIMAPLTRLRATPEHVPTQLMAEYYAQRSGAVLIISEGIPVIPQGVGYANVPGIWSTDQIEAWKLITKAVHQAEGRIFAQLWHVGRISDPRFLDGRLPVAPSAIRPAGHVSLVPSRGRVRDTARAWDVRNSGASLRLFRNGAENAKLAGFDGVEIHGANGYLLDQFLQDGSNHRTDEYGGPIENRARLMLEVADAVISIWGAKRVGMHLAPRGDSQDMHDSNPPETFGYVARELGKAGNSASCLRASISDPTDWTTNQEAIRRRIHRQ